MTRVMFTGAHGIGKSASAMKLNKALPDYLYIPSFAGTVAKRVGFDLNRPHTVQQLVDYQERVLSVFVESFKATQMVDTIYDRSPNDLAAYFTTGVRDTEYAKEYAYKVADFTNRCIEATNEYCDILVYPEADFTEPMQNKHNRPVGDKYSREEFDRLLDLYAGKVSKKVKVIDVPLQYQYDARVNYILESMKLNVRV